MADYVMDEQAKLNKQMVDDRKQEDELHFAGPDSRLLYSRLKRLGVSAWLDHARADALAHEYLGKLVANKCDALVDPQRWWNQWINKKTSWPNAPMGIDAKNDAYKKIVEPTVNHLRDEMAKQLLIYANEAKKAFSLPHKQRASALTIERQFWTKCQTDTGLDQDDNKLAQKLYKELKLNEAFERALKADEQAEQHATQAPSPPFTQHMDNPEAVHSQSRHGRRL